MINLDEIEARVDSHVYLPHTADTDIRALLAEIRRLQAEAARDDQAATERFAIARFIRAEARAIRDLDEVSAVPILLNALAARIEHGAY